MSSEMHGYIDSIAVPVHLDKLSVQSKQQQKGKGKQDKDTPDVYDVAAEWTAQERDAVQRKLQLAASRQFKSRL